MSARGDVLGGVMRRRVLFASLVLLAALLALVPGDLRGDETWKECVDGSFAGYNDCLMESGGWFDRKLCDVSWEFEVTLCTARKVGEIRDAWDGEAN